MGFTQFMHFSVTTFGKVATGKDVEHDCTLPRHSVTSRADDTGD
jgi:hypothetical protein